MPELPEVETTCRGIETAIVDETILNIKIRESRLRWPVSQELFKLKKEKIISVERRAKYILLRCSSGTIIIHLGMSGRLCVLEEGSKHQKHDHVDFILDNGKLLRFTDHRRFGSILWTEEDPFQHSLLVNLGPEPLSKTFNANYLFARTRNKKQAIKLLIMDQRVVVGVGNIYANEALFSAKILPDRPSTSLTLAECDLLVKMIKQTLKQAILQGGTTLRDFLSPTGKKGYFVQKLLVYGREGESCLSCKTLLSSSRIGQRATVFCLGCQK
jgi:formamidopyrimidine-DNA glycosylase